MSPVVRLLTSLWRRKCRKIVPKYDPCLMIKMWMVTLTSFFRCERRQPYTLARDVSRYGHVAGKILRDFRRKNYVQSVWQLPFVTLWRLITRMTCYWRHASHELFTFLKPFWCRNFVKSTSKNDRIWWRNSDAATWRHLFVRFSNFFFIDFFPFVKM